MTGLQRRDVSRISGDRQSPTKDVTLLIRVVGQWSADKRFSNSRGKGRSLGVSGVNSEFAKLVKLVSKDLNPHTILFELERLGIIRRKGNTATLTTPAVVHGGDRPAGSNGTENTVKRGSAEGAQKLTGFYSGMLAADGLAQTIVCATRTAARQIAPYALQKRIALVVSMAIGLCNRRAREMTIFP